MRMECMRIGPEKVDAMISYAFGHNLSHNEHALNGQTAKLHGQTASLHGQTASLHGQMPSLHAQTVSLNGQVAALNGQTASLHGQTSSLHGQTSSLHGQTPSLHGQTAPLNVQTVSLNGQTEPGYEPYTALETLNGSVDAYATQEYEDGLNGQPIEGVTTSLDLNDNMEEPGSTPTKEISRSPVKTPSEQTTNNPRLPSSLEASTGSGYFFDDDFSTQLDGNYAAIDMDTFENEDISSFFAIYNNKAPESKMVLVRTRSDSALYNYELELSMSERTSSRGQSSSGYDCVSSAEVSFRSEHVYSPGMTHSSLQSGPLFTSSGEGAVPQNLYSTDSLDRTDIDCSILTDEDFNLGACHANKDNYILAFDRSPTKYSDDEQDYHDAWLSDATESIDGATGDDDGQSDSEYIGEMEHSAGEVVYLDDYYSNEHEPLLAEHMLLSADHEVPQLGAEGAIADAHWNESDEPVSEESGSDDTQVVPEDCGYRSASEQEDSAINVPDGDSLCRSHDDADQSEADNTMDDYDSQLLDEVEQELQLSTDNQSQSFAYDNLSFEDISLQSSNHQEPPAPSYECPIATLKKMAASDSAQLISPDYEVMYSYPEGLSEVLAGRMSGGRLLRRWRNIQQNLHNLSSSEPTTTSDPTDSIELARAFHPLTSFGLLGKEGALNKGKTSWGAMKNGASVDQKSDFSSSSTLENISWSSKEASTVNPPKTLTTWQQVKKSRTPQTSWKKIKEMKQLLRDEDLSSSASKCKSAPNLAQECEEEVDEIGSIRYRPKRQKVDEDEPNKRHSFTLFEIFRRSKSEDTEYGKLPSPIYQKLYGSLVSNDGYFMNQFDLCGSTGMSSMPWTLESDASLQQSRSSSINKINSCVATPGSSDNSAGSSPSSEANLIPPPYSHPSVNFINHDRPVLDDQSLQKHDAATRGLVQEVSLLPIIHPRFNLSNASQEPVMNFGYQGTGLKRDHAEMQSGALPRMNGARKNVPYDPGLVGSAGKFMDSISSYSGDTVTQPVFTTSSPAMSCRGVQTSVTLMQSGKVQKSVQTSIEKDLSSDENYLSVEKDVKPATSPILQVGSSPTSQSLLYLPVSQSNLSLKSDGYRNKSKRHGNDYLHGDDESKPDKDKLTRSLMFMNTKLPDLSFLNPRGMSKSQGGKPQRSKSCDYTATQKGVDGAKLRSKLKIIENTESLTDAETLACEIAEKRSNTRQSSPQKNKRLVVLMNNDIENSTGSVDSVARATGNKRIEIVRNGEKLLAKKGNKMTNVEKDKMEKSPKNSPEEYHRACRDQATDYHGDLSSTSSGMDVSSDSQGSHSNSVLNNQRMSRRDVHAHTSHHRCSSRSHECHHCRHGNHYNYHGNHCMYRNRSLCHRCFTEQMHAMHHGNGCMHQWGHYRGHTSHQEAPPEQSHAYYSDDDYHSQRSNRVYNEHRTDACHHWRHSAMETDSSDSHTACETAEATRSLDRQGSYNDSDTSSTDGRQLKPIIKQRYSKRRTCSAPSGGNLRRCSNSTESSETPSERSSGHGSDNEVLSDDGSAPTTWSSDDHSVIRGNGHHSNQRNMTNSEESNESRHSNDCTRQRYGINLKNDNHQRQRHSHAPCCGPPCQRPMYPPCCMPMDCFHGYGHMMWCCHGDNFCCGGHYGGRSHRNKKSVSFSEEIKYHSPYSSPHCSPKKQQKLPPLQQENGRAPSDDRRNGPRDRGHFYPETHVSESSVDSAIGSESPPREFQISPTQRKTFDFDESLQSEGMRLKKDLVLEVGRAVEVIQSHYSQAMDSQERIHLGTSSDCPKVGSLLLSHLCPAIYNLLGDGLRPRIHCVFGQVKNNLWKVVEESSELCISVAKVMNDIVKEVKSQICLGSPLSKFNAFIFGLLNAKALDDWLNILFSQDKLIRKHYAPDAFLVLSTTTRGRHLFDEVIRAVRPLASLPFRVECNFEFKFRQTLSPRSETNTGPENFRRNPRLRRQRSLDDLLEPEGAFSKFNGRLQLVQSNSTLSSSDSSSQRELSSSDEREGQAGGREEPALPELFQKTDVMQYIQQAREWIENGTKISDSAMDYLGQRFHREFGQFSQHPTENNRWSLPPIETVFSLANFFSRSSIQNESPSIEGFAMYLARISADAEAKRAPDGKKLEKLPSNEVTEVESEDETVEDDLISFEDDSKGTLKEKDGASSGSDIASLSSGECDLKVEQLIKDNEIVSPQLLELDDAPPEHKDKDWLIEFKLDDDVAYKSTDYEFGKLSIAEGGVDISEISPESNSSFDQHLDDMGIIRQEVIRPEDYGVKRLSCPLLRFNDPPKDEPKRWSLGASLINVFDKLLLDAPQKSSLGSSSPFVTPPGGHLLDSPIQMEDASSISESFRTASSCGESLVPLPPVKVEAPPVELKESPEKTSVAVRPKELSLRRPAVVVPMSTSAKSDDSQSKATKRYVKALCFHLASDSEQLSFDKGDIMMTLKELDDDWYFCCHGNKTGLVHQACVKEIEESEVLRLLNNSTQGE